MFTFSAYSQQLVINKYGKGVGISAYNQTEALECPLKDISKTHAPFDIIDLTKRNKYQGARAFLLHIILAVIFQISVRDNRYTPVRVLLERDKGN